MSAKPVPSVLRLTSEGMNRCTAASVVPVSEPILTRADKQPSSGPFHFTRRMSQLCADAVHRTPLLGHIDMERVLVTFTNSRNEQVWGLQAKLIPLRFRGGRITELRRGHLYTIQRHYVDESELLYVLTFYLPRFLNQRFEEKMITVFHELYHIHADFNGDVRRFKGTTSVHAGSRRDFDKRMAELARHYLSKRPPGHLYGFLRHSYDELCERHGEVVGVKIPVPKLIPVSGS